ncbi:uncharacterized protein METZ01_LOCUS326326 [marine metagenome]|uniref:Uncharacterized protein n=1 Tax=marine metagenome TaxID=408172 RepID=A0A382PNB0_9ZZZZ
MLKKDNLSKNDLLSENLLFFYDHSFGSTYQYIDSLNSEVNNIEEIKKVDCSERASLVASNIKSALEIPREDSANIICCGPSPEEDTY